MTPELLLGKLIWHLPSVTAYTVDMRKKIYQLKQTICILIGYVQESPTPILQHPGQISHMCIHTLTHTHNIT